MNDADIWRTAREMIQQYGADAQIRAKQRAEKLVEYGIPEGGEECGRAWRRPLPNWTGANLKAAKN